jgi:hypothetical protein
MNDLDELLNNSLRRDVAVTDNRLPTIIARGRKARQRKTAVLGSVAAVVAIAIATTAIAALSGARRGSTITDVSDTEPIVSVTTAPDTSAPITSVTTVTTATPTSAEQSVSTTESAPPAAETKAPAFVALRSDGSIEMRNGDEVTTAPPVCPDGSCQVMGSTFRNGQLWATTVATAQIPGTPSPSQIWRYDSNAGQWTVAYTVDDPDLSLSQLAVGADGTVWAVAYPPGDGPAQLLRIVDGAAETIAQHATAVITSEDGRYLAFARADPLNNLSEIVVEDLATGETKTLLPGDDSNPDAFAKYYFPIPIEWSSDGAYLVVDDGFEEATYTYIRPFEAASQGDTTVLFAGPSPVENACFVGPGQLATAGWDHPYAEDPARPGPMSLVDLATGANVGSYGSTSVLAESLACDANGDVAFIGDDGALMRLAVDGTLTTLGTGYTSIMAP